MADDKPFRVVVIGGSLAGLMLGNMLQLNGIDFIILEAYPKIAPQTGASIGLLPNGNRILDQLGLFDTILGQAPPVEKFSFRNSKGQRISGHSGMRDSFIQRHGYPILFLDQQAVLQVLYDNIKDKSKVLTEKRLAKIGMNEKGVKAIMTDGSEFTGDILIGADGIHSSVRSEMWRLANKRSPGYIPATEKEAPPCHYSCLYGISNPVEGLEPGELHSVFREKNSYLINGGPEGRVYWFYLFKNPKTTYGPDIPRYTKEDEARVLEEHENDLITPEITFKALQERKISSTLTAVPEYVYKKWYFERIATIGDSVHMFNPIGGHGANSAFETSASFVNSLVKNLRKSPKPMTFELNEMFADIQKLREGRVTTLKNACHEQNRTDAEYVMFNISGNQPYAEKLDMVELSPRPKLIPYKDELEKPPALRGSIGWFQMLFYISLSVSAYYGMWVRSNNEGLTDQFQEILRSPRLAAQTDDSLGILSMYFSGMLIQLMSVWLVEACRKRNDMNLVALPTVWFAISQWLGFGVTIPVFYTAYTLFSNAEPYWWPLSRPVPAHYVKVILPSVLIGYVLPTILIFVPWTNETTAETFDEIWWHSTMITSLLTFISGLVLKKVVSPPVATPNAADKPKDFPYLKSIYLTTFALGVALHVTVFSSILLSSNPKVTLASVFIPNSTADIRNCFLVEFWSLYVASFAWSCNAVWDIKRVGRTTVDVGKAAVLLLLASLALGPGAALVTCWYWRELQMARTSVLAKNGRLCELFCLDNTIQTKKARQRKKEETKTM